MPSIGLLYPGHSAEDDFPALEARIGGDLQLPLVHTSVGEDAHRVDALLDLGGPERLAEGARVLLAEHSPDVIMWACTSGSFVFGWEGAHEQVALLEQATGLPTSSTSIAFVEACRSLDLTRVSVAASYPEDVAQEFVSYLGRGGIQVTAMGSHGIVTAAEVGTLGYAEVEAIVRGADLTGGAQAVLVPDTAMHTLEWIEPLEQAAGVPVLTANQVTIWQGLNLLGPIPHISALGTLFTRGGGD
ncbi:maleate cis-trans isomerase [Ornithinimicrobium ciconiae]|uniref:Maleate cis-trans isomerase n=1 Tax=Ornithinimicrobium ciconiae TaxID=2594265 RepID=A0A516GCR9_9MICO|nr:maleate cis-trans isomerase [Ornithinimicrobium ciconiae]QDO89326.1 maleate cis-trans isomerase [Ornithinimicrobium ciconiae]